MRKVERALSALPNVSTARANLSSRRVTVEWRGESDPPDIWQALQNIGFDSHVHVSSETSDSDRQELTKLLRDLAISGFAAGNIMMLSMSVWYGATSDYSALFHWLSALLALAALAFAGRTFFHSAARALAAGTTNMDVPISVGLVLTYAISLYDTIAGAQNVYFDAAAMLLFFLLIGRTLDHITRSKASETIQGLESLHPSGVTVFEDNGTSRFVPLADVVPGMTVQVVAGERVVVDGEVLKGTSEVDASLVSGESEPVRIVPQSRLIAGMRNLGNPVTMIASARAEDSFIAQMSRMMAIAESNQSRFRSLSDRIAQYYAPVVHLAALSALILWLSLGSELHRSVQVAVSVLIITCPCALALAVPMVNTIASSRLFESGVFVRSVTALERMSEVDTIVFDKTGTLTTAKPVASIVGMADQAELSIARQLAALSQHPNSVAIVDGVAAPIVPSSIVFGNVQEMPGEGIEGVHSGSIYRLGRPDWALHGSDAAGRVDARVNVVLSVDGRLAVAFEVSGVLLPDARSAIAALKERGYALAVLSGDTAARVEHITRQLEIAEYKASQTPEGKLRFVYDRQDNGQKILMIGDGLNDVPSLAGSHVAMTPTNAADIGRSRADFVFLDGRLSSIGEALIVSRFAQTLTKQNIAIALIYNLIAVPLAFMGFVTPLLAAIAMSTSSILVVLNSLRLRWAGPRSQCILKTDFSSVSGAS